MERGAKRESGGAARRLGAALLMLVVLVGLIWFLRPDPEPPADVRTENHRVAAGVLSQLRAAVRARDFEAFSGTVSETARRAHRPAEREEEAFRSALSAVDPADFRAAATLDDADDTGAVVVVTGAALPAALGIDPRDAPHGIALRIEQEAGRATVVSAGPAAERRGHSDRATDEANRAVMTALRPPRLWDTLGGLARSNAVRENLDALRKAVESGERLPPSHSFELDAERFDEVSGAWRVDVLSPELKEALGLRTHVIELTLALTPAGPGRPTSYTVASARLVE